MFTFWEEPVQFEIFLGVCDCSNFRHYDNCVAVVSFKEYVLFTSNEGAYLFELQLLCITSHKTMI